jgi:hypothetical protein
MIGENLQREVLVMGQKMARFISILSVAPLVAFFTLTWLLISRPYLFEGKTYWYIMAIIFLTVVPALAYLGKFVSPRLRQGGRDAERKLAFILSLAGYGAGWAASLLANGPRLVLMIFTGYLLSGSTLALVNRVLKFKASGHACGVAGPLTLAGIIGGGIAWALWLVLPAVFWGRLRMGRHTLGQLFAGTLCGAIPTACAYFLIMGSAW